MAPVEFPGARSLLAAHSAALPQPDQLCGPFAASVALAAIVDDALPSLAGLALASGSTVWPHEIPRGRPPGIRVRFDGWEVLPTAEDAHSAGTTAAGLAAGIERATHGRISVIPIARPGSQDLRLLCTNLLRSSLRFALIANVHTGPLTETDWNVGHFVVMWAFDALADSVVVADTYRELGAQGMPVGCRTIGTTLLADAMSDRGVLLLVSTQDREQVMSVVDRIGVRPTHWSI